MEELGSALGRFVGGIGGVDELRGAFRDYLQRYPDQRAAVSEWLNEGIRSGRVSPAVMLTLRDLLEDASGSGTPTLATRAAPRPRPPLERSPGSIPPPIAPGPVGTARSANSLSATRAQAVPMDDDAGALRIGSVLNARYTLIAELGHGGMGTVYKARDRQRDEFQDRHPFVALKVLSEEFKRHPDAIMALQRETVRAQSLAHPNITTVYEFYYEHGLYAYMTMELLEGQPLDNLLQNESFRTTPFARRWQIVRSIGAGLAYAHEKGVVHSDLKPGNIFMCKNGVVKVMDFGIARPLRSVADETETTRFDAAERLGGLTPAYASLEQWNRDPPDPRDDIYAFACVMYFVFSGRHPFARASAKNAFETRLVPQRIDSLTRRQWDALRRGLALRREDRIGSVEEFLRLFAPQTWLQKYRLWVSGVTAAAAAVLLFFAAQIYGEYVQNQDNNAKLWPPVVTSAEPLSADQRREIDELLYLANDAMTRAGHAQSADEFLAIMSKGANNLHDMLYTVRQLDPAKPEALRLTDTAAQAFAPYARSLLASNKLADAHQMIVEGQRFENTRDLLRLRQDLCRRSPAVCNGE